ncbi:MAG: heparan-alpha-glucosaminide N-acetyltransferase [Sterolibacterium sp.]
MSARSAHRLASVDAVRGGAIVAMILYHLGFDLNYLGWLHQNINADPLWLTARALILSSFLFTVGASFALAEASGVSRRTQLARVVKISAAALLVTAGSWIAFPNSAIYFGVLHAIAVMSILLLVIPQGVWPACTLGVAAIWLGNGYASGYFDQPALAWIGLMTRKPLTEDYVPILPWFGACLIGYGLAHKMVRHRGFEVLQQLRPRPRLLCWMGRHSLAIYLLHQPVLLGLLIPLTALLKP